MHRFQRKKHFKHCITKHHHLFPKTVHTLPVTQLKTLNSTTHFILTVHESQFIIDLAMFQGFESLSFALVKLYSIQVCMEV